MTERGKKLHFGLECGEPSASFPLGKTCGLSPKEHMAKAQGVHGAVACRRGELVPVQKGFLTAL